MHDILSIVIPTYNRAAVLRLTLEALSQQDLEPAGVEIIVVDDGSCDDTAEVVTAAIPACPFRLRYSYQENRGAATARNRGLTQAQGRIVLFIDDDILAAPPLLLEHLRFHEKHLAENIAVLGRVVLASEVSQTTVNRLHAVHKWQNICHGAEVDWRHFRTGNISVKRRFLLDNQLLFDEALRYLEDTEMGYRASQHGMRIIYDAQAIGCHCHDMTVPEFLRLNWNYGSTLATLHKRHPNLQAELASYLTFSWHNPPGRLLHDILRTLLMNRGTATGLLTLIHLFQASNRDIPAGLVHRLGSYYERQGYRKQLRKLQQARSAAV